MPLQQKQYLTHYAPMVIERWVLPIFKRPASRLKTPVQYLGLPLSAHPMRSASSSTDLNLEKLPPFDDMYICDFCNQTYHWACLKNTGCYTERQREVDKK